MKILHFNWAAFDALARMKYVTGVAVMLALTAVIDFPWFAAGLSALLAWLTNLPGDYRERILGVLIYIGLGGRLLSWLISFRGPTGHGWSPCSWSLSAGPSE